MTRFIYIADTHLCATENGYHQQPRYTVQLPALLAALDAWIEMQDDIAFVLHGGDIVDQATPTTLRAAREAFRLSVPVYLCLGNHDLTAPNAVTLWPTEAPEFFPDQCLTYSLTLPDCIIHVVPTQWCATPFFWTEEQTPHFLAEQRAYLATTLERHSDRRHLLCTHSEVLGVPPEQTGLAEPIHAPLPAFTQMILDLTRTYPHLCGVLSAHNHINTHNVQGNTHLITVSALTETPFEFKVFTVTTTQFTMETVSLLPAVAFKATYDFDKTYVQGRYPDRAFGIQVLETATNPTLAR